MAEAQSNESSSLGGQRRGRHRSKMARKKWPLHTSDEDPAVSTGWQRGQPSFILAAGVASGKPESIWGRDFPWLRESAPRAMTVAAAASVAPGSPQNGLWGHKLCVRGTIIPKCFSS